MQTHFKLYTAVLAERSELLVQCIFINDSLLSLHFFLKPLEFVQCLVVLMETISYYSLYNKLPLVGLEPSVGSRESSKAFALRHAVGLRVRDRPSVSVFA